MLKPDNCDDKRSDPFTPVEFHSFVPFKSIQDFKRGPCQLKGRAPMNYTLNLKTMTSVVDLHKSTVQERHAGYARGKHTEYYLLPNSWSLSTPGVL